MNKHNVLHFAEVVIIVFLFFYLAVAQEFFLSKSTTTDNSVPTFKEPPALSIEPNTTAARIDDLVNLGCHIFHLRQNGYYMGGTFTFDNYTEFRRIAYNSKLVFVGFSESYLFTVLDGIMYYYY